MWIAHLSFGHKKLLLLTATSVASLFLSVRLPVSLSVGINSAIITIWIMVFCATYTFGVYRRRYRFNLYHETFDVIDFYHFKFPTESKRYILHVESGDVESNIYLRKQDRWAYFDLIRLLIKSYGTIPKRNALLLGGGGGSVGLSLMSDFSFSRVDIAEQSRLMIRIARSFFIPSGLHGLRYYNAEAGAFVQQAKRQYHLVFVDLFRGIELVEQFFTHNTLMTTRSLVSPRGLLIINFGSLRNRVIKRVCRAFPNITLCLWGKNLVGIWSTKKKTVSQTLKKHNILVLPKYT